MAEQLSPDVRPLCAMHDIKDPNGLCTCTYPLEGPRMESSNDYAEWARKGMQMIQDAATKPLHEEIERLRTALELMYDKWENGTPCTDDWSDGPSVGNAFKLTDEEERMILALIPGQCTHPALAVETSSNARDAEARWLLSHAITRETRIEWTNRRDAWLGQPLSYPEYAESGPAKVSCVWIHGCRLANVCEREGRCIGGDTVSET